MYPDVRRDIPIPSGYIGKQKHGTHGLLKTARAAIFGADCFMTSLFIKESSGRGIGARFGRAWRDGRVNQLTGQPVNQRKMGLAR